MSKVKERIVSEQLKSYLSEANLIPPLQSAYLAGRSTETALVKVMSDIIYAADTKKVTLLGLLDMSAAFDTVNFDILLERLGTTLGICGQAHAWFKSFLF